jgi:hypothetical protein
MKMINFSLICKYRTYNSLRSKIQRNEFRSLSSKLTKLIQKLVNLIMVKGNGLTPIIKISLKFIINVPEIKKK